FAALPGQPFWPVSCRRGGIMRRREFFATLGGALAVPLVAQAQPARSVRQVGVLMGFPEQDTQAQSYVRAMQQKLESLGWAENRNIHITYRWAGGDPDVTRAFAKELVQLSPSVIVTSTNQVTEIMRRETKKNTIVFASLGDPVGSGLVASLNRPGGNVTGFPAFVDTMSGKLVQLLTEIVPRVERVGFVFHPDVAPHRGLLRAAQATAPALNVTLLPFPVRDASEIAAAIAAFASGGNGGLAVASHAAT